MKKIVKCMLAAMVGAAIILPNLSMITEVGTKLVTNLLTEEDTLVYANIAVVPDETKLPVISGSVAKVTRLTYTYGVDEDLNVYYSVVADLNYYKGSICSLSQLSKQLSASDSIANYPNVFGAYDIKINGEEASECKYIKKVEVRDLLVNEVVDESGNLGIRQEFRLYLRKPVIEEDLNVVVTYSNLITDMGVMEASTAKDITMYQNVAYKDIEKKTLSIKAKSSWGASYDVTGYSMEKDGIHLYTKLPDTAEPSCVEEGDITYNNNVHIRATDNIGNLYILYPTYTNDEMDFQLTENTYSEYDNKNVLEFDKNAKTLTFQVIEERTNFKGCNYVNTDLTPISEEVTIDLTK